MDLSYFFRIFLRRLPYIIIFVAIGAGIGISVAMRMPETYRAQSVLIVEAAQIPGELAASTVHTGQLEQVQIIRQRLTSRENLLELANRFRIYADDPEAAAMTPDQKVADLQSRIGFDIYTENATVIVVSFSAPTGQMAADVTNELVTMLLQENVRIRTTTAGQTLEFFDQEVDRLEQSLTRVSEQILAFKEENLEALPDSLNFRRSQQAGLQERLLRLEREMTALQDRRDNLETLFASTDGAAFRQARQVSPEEARLQELQREYSSQLALLSPENPRMTLLSAQIEALEQVVEEQRAASAEQENAEDQALTNFELQIADLDAQIDYMQDEQARIETQMAQLEQTIEATPGNAITLETLERDYENLRVQYNQAVASRARAETGDIIESLSKGQRISVLEQATVPSSPASPNRPVIAAMGVGGGFAFGAALFLLIELLSSSVKRPEDIRKALGVDVFATIPYIRTQREIWRRRVIVIGISAAIVVGVPAGLWYVDTQVTPLQPLFDSLLSRINLAST